MHTELLYMAQSLYGAQYDEDYPSVVVVNRPIPGVGADGVDSEGVALSHIRCGLEDLVGLGAEIIVSVCNSLISQLTSVRVAADVVDIISATTANISGEPRSVGLLTSRGLRDSGEYSRALDDLGIKAVALDDAHQEVLDGVILELMGGRHEGVSRGLRNAVSYLEDRGAEHIIAGCTELGTVNLSRLTNIPITDSLSAAARVAVTMSYEGV
jgi:aspartate/glutamate racemase